LFLVVGFFALVVSHPDRWLANMRVINQQHCSPDTCVFLFVSLARFVRASRADARHRGRAHDGRVRGGLWRRARHRAMQRHAGQQYDLSSCRHLLPRVGCAASEAISRLPSGPISFRRESTLACCHVGDEASRRLWTCSCTATRVARCRTTAIGRCGAGTKWPLDLTALHYDCPACTMDSCLKKTAVVLAEPNVTTLCGLDAAFVPRREAAFCSPACQVWARVAAAHGARLSALLRLVRQHDRHLRRVRQAALARCRQLRSMCRAANLYASLSINLQINVLIAKRL
jgi:hypothetical protein